MIEHELRQAVSKALFRDSMLQVFEDIDVNTDGVLDRKEIEAKLRAMGHDDDEVESFLHMSDINRDGTLSVAEFLGSFSQFLVSSKMTASR